jgi:hypothetical protein
MVWMRRPPVFSDFIGEASRFHLLFVAIVMWRAQRLQLPTEEQRRITTMRDHVIRYLCRGHSAVG